MVDLSEGAEALKAGEPLIFETDTVVGIGVSVNHNADPSVLYKTKSRSDKKPIAWLISNTGDLSKFGLEVPDYAYAIADEFWPGALTIIVKASDKVPTAYRSSSGSIGLRLPHAATITDLIDKVGGPIATTSANLSNTPAVCSIYEIDKGFAPNIKRLAYFTDSNKISMSSTVIDCTGSAPVILRAGTITQSDIDACLLRLEKR